MTYLPLLVERARGQEKAGAEVGVKETAGAEAAGQEKEVADSGLQKSEFFCDEP